MKTISKQSNPLVAIVGRPNVGKSTLFNRLIGERKSIVEAEPGVTRDRVYAEGEWVGRQFSLVDTGGLIPDTSGEIMSLVRKQVKVAIEEADLLIFLVNVQERLTAIDEDIAKWFRRIDKPVILVANKADNPRLEEDALSFYRLGLSHPIPISAMHGLNINELLDKMLESLPLKGQKGEQKEGIKVAVVGRPNVGKSSFINTLLREERLIVSDKPGTTRDAIDTVFYIGEEKFIFVDTAGMRPKSRVKKKVESYSIIRSRRSIERADIVLLLTDAQEGVTSQDSKIASYICEEGRGCIIVVNKWDLIVESLKLKGKNKRKGQAPRVESLRLKVESQKNNQLPWVEMKKVREEYSQALRDKLRFLNFAPSTFISALTGEGVFKIIDLIRMVAHQQTIRLSSGILGKVFEEAKDHYKPPGGQAKPVTLHRLSQVGIKPPTFVLFANHPQFIADPYLRYLSNRLRQAFGFEGTPLKIIPRKGR